VAEPKRSTDEDNGATAVDGTMLIANLLGLLLCKGQNNTESLKILSRAGFTNRQIASLLDTTSETVRVALHKANKKKPNRG
jgi:DNA-binding NarL/FixJ family response regulator